MTNCIWIIVGAWNYEGYSLPTAAFSTEADAIKYLNKNRSAIQRLSHYDEIEVVAIPLGAADPSDLGDP